MLEQKRQLVHRGDLRRTGPRSAGVAVARTELVLRTLSRPSFQPPPKPQLPVPPPEVEAALTAAAARCCNGCGCGTTCSSGPWMEPLVEVSAEEY